MAPMHQLVLLAFVSAALSLSALAGTYKIPAEDPVTTVTLPDDWKTDEIDDGIEATSSDGEVYLAIEETDGDSIKASLDEAMKYLKSKGVTVTESSLKQQEGKIGEMDVVDISWDGKDEDGPAKISLTVVAVTKTEGLLLIYWASPEGEKKNMQALGAIAKSIKKA